MRPRPGLLLFLLLTTLATSCAYRPVSQDSSREPAQSRTPVKKDSCDPDSAFVKNTSLVCEGCRSGEFCITVYYDTDSLSSIKRRVTPFLRTEIASQRNIPGRACADAIGDIAGQIAAHAMQSISDFKDHRDRDRKRHLAQLVAFDKASIHKASVVISSCGSDCDAIIATGREWAQVVVDGTDLLSEKDARTNIGSWKKELKVPTGCQDQFDSALRAIFKQKMQGANSSGAGGSTNPGTSEIEGTGSGTGSGTTSGAGNGSTGGTGGLISEDNAPLCQAIPEDVIVGTDSGKCLADEQKLWDFLESSYLKNLHSAINKNMKTPILDCSPEDVMGGPGDEKPTPSGMRNVKVPCYACVTSTDILGLLSEDLDKNAEKWTQRGVDWLEYRYCWTKLGFGTTTSGVSCKEYLEKYKQGNHHANVARMIGPEHLPALERALEEFERKGYENERYRNLINGAIRVPTKIVIPGVNRRICLAGQWVSYDKSLAMRNGELRANAENEKYYVWDRNFGQGAASTVANWLSMVKLNPYEATEEEIDCISIPARLVREALREQRCGGISAIRTMIYEGLKAQGNGKTLVNAGVGIASGILPVGLAGSAVIACSQGALEARTEMLNKEARIDRERLEMVMSQNKEELSKAQALQKFYLKNKQSWDEEKNKLYVAGYWSVLENCVKGSATVGVYYKITKSANKAIEISKVSGTPKMFFEQLASSPVLVDTVVHSISTRSVSWIDVVEALPITLRVEGLTISQLKDTVEYEVKTNGEVSVRVRELIQTEINRLQTKDDSKLMREFIANLSSMINRNNFQKIKIPETKVRSKKKLESRPAANKQKPELKTPKMKKKKNRN
ncbi:MAG TPA: hypothetical protein VNJ01_06490 [Bacteriovoracaceae bacterium]|nr:hypothetical protein [Bacteriovoracaceae bacterium]